MKKQLKRVELTHSQVHALMDTVVFVDLANGGAVKMRVTGYKRAFGHDKWGLSPLEGVGTSWYDSKSLRLVVPNENQGLPNLVPAGWPKNARSGLMQLPPKGKQTWALLVQRLQEENAR